MNQNASMYVIFGIQQRQVKNCEEGEPVSNTDNFWTPAMALDFLAGCVGGCAGVLVGHPLDTIKVHLQTQDVKNPKYRGTWHCMQTIVAQDKVRGLYRGITSPMSGVGFVNAIVFGVYGNVQRHFENPHSLQSHFMAGSIAGLMQSIVCAPMELAKTRIQLQTENYKGTKFKGPLACLKHIARTEGMRGMFKGLGITALRDIPGFSCYFVSYEYMMSLPSSPKAVHSLMAGGLAGICSWLACYPMDVVKTCLQADGMNSVAKYSGAMDVVRKGYKANGLYFFCRGINSTCIRAFPMNAACFYVVSLILSLAKTTDLGVVVQSAEPLAMVGLASTPLCHIHKHEDEELERKRFFMVRSLKALGEFNEAVCHTEVEELANEFYPRNTNNKYYLFEDERLQMEIENINSPAQY